MAGAPIWLPQEGPQSKAFYSLADVVGYGGAAGGGKTDLEIGLALTQHVRSIIYRKEGTQLEGIYDRIEEIVGTKDGFSRQIKKWRYDGKIIEFGGLADPNDHKKFQGRPHDLVMFDECTEIPEYMVRFLMGWTRSNKADQRCRVLMAFNPPTTTEGRWVLDYFGPWLNKNHPNKAQPGELRWYTTIAGKDTEVPNGDLIDVDGDMVQPESRTFIPAKVEDNIFYMESGYKAKLQALPEPLRSQMLKGDFAAGMKDDPWQVIPTDWVEAAMDRWQPLTQAKPMDSMGVDPSRGGDDFTVISRRHGNWFDNLIKAPGSAVPSGSVAAGMVIAARRNKSPIHVDVIGVGASCFDFLRDTGVQAVPVIANGSAVIKAKGKHEGDKETSKEGELTFADIRAMLWWRMREALDPDNGLFIALPKDDDLKSQLCLPKWWYTKGGIRVQSKEEIYKELQRSTDDADAVVMANIDTPKTLKRKPAIKIGTYNSPLP